MARVPADELDRIKREVSVAALAEARGVALRPHGADLIGLCPFHDDHEPSLVVTPSKNLWHCLGACQAGGSPIDWVMRAQGVSFRHAAELLRKGYGGSADSGASPPGPPPKHAKIPKLPVALDAEDAALLGQVVGYYHETLKESPEAIAYLESRGLTSPEIIERFQLGFANRTLGYRLPSRDSKEGREIRGRLERLGILRTSGHEHFNGSVILPIFGADAQVVELYGRKVTRELRAGTPVHLYLPGPHRGVWNREALLASKEIILCEALLDALTFWCAGFRNVTSAYGVSGFTEEHLEAFKKHGTERVLIAYDRDDAGDKAAAALAERLAAEGIEASRILFPRGMDANEYARKVKPAEKSLDVVIRGAQWMAGKPRSVRDPDPEVIEEEPSEQLPVVPGPPESSSPLAADPRPPASPVLSASPDHPSESPAVSVEVREGEVVLVLGPRRWRIRGLARNLSFDLLKVNVLVASGEAFHVDTFDLYSAKQRAAFTGHAAAELGVKEDVIRKDLGKVLLKLEELQEEQIRKTLEPKEEAVSLTEEERAEALAFLRDPKLLERIGADFEACGLVGEEMNRLVGYLAAVSRKLEKPLAVLIQSSSAAGKSALMEAILALVPEEERVQYSAMTGQSLFYMDGASLKHKVLAIAEEEGAERASYALKLLQSEGRLSIASTGKDPASGRLVTHEYHVEGPVAILFTTTAIDLDEELLNRCVVLTVDEGREQTRAIHKLQREADTLEGWRRKRKREEVQKLHRNAQRLLRPLAVVNPYAHALTFADSSTRMRRDHEKYLALIRAIALLFQYQRPVKTDGAGSRAAAYIEVTLADIELANRLAGEVLGRTLDELPPQTRRLLALLEAHVAEACRRLAVAREDYRFTRRTLREATGWGDTQLKVHLGRLAEMEYLAIHRAEKGGFAYELLYEGQGNDGKPFLLGLIDVEKLRLVPRYGYNRSGSPVLRSDCEAEWSAPGRPLVGGVSGGGRDGANAVRKPKTPDFEPEAPENAYRGYQNEAPSYAAAPRTGLALLARVAEPERSV